MSLNIGFDVILKKILTNNQVFRLLLTLFFFNESDFTAVDDVTYVPTALQFPCPNQRYLVISSHLIF